MTDFSWLIEELDLNEEETAFFEAAIQEDSPNTLRVSTELGWSLEKTWNFRRAVIDKYDSFYFNNSEDPRLLESAPEVSKKLRGPTYEMWVKRNSVRFMPLHPDAQLPKYQTEHSAGMDLHSVESVLIHPMETVLVPTGLAMAIPEGHEGQVRPRSGLALKHNLTILNSPGTIDSDYRGEVKVILTNLGSSPYEIQKGDRIAQIVFAPVSRFPVTISSSLEDTERGAGGFGSTGW